MRFFLWLSLLAINGGWGAEILGMDSVRALSVWKRSGSDPRWWPSDAGLPQIPAHLEFNKGKLVRVRFESPRAFSRDDLWALLDWLGETSAWWEVDLKGHLDSRLRPRADLATQLWFLESPARGSLAAALIQRGASAVLVVELLEPQRSGATPLPPLECRFNGALNVLDEFVLQGTGGCLSDPSQACVLIHREDHRLRVLVQGSALRFEFHDRDSEPLPVMRDFAALDARRRMEIVEDYLAYFHHERVLAARLFFESVPGLFNWQPWYWVRKDYGGVQNAATVEALLLSGGSSDITLVNMSCADGRRVRLSSNGQGMLQLTVR